MDREHAKADLLRFLRTIQRPDAPIDDIDENDGLVESGLIDSLSLLQIILYLEQTYCIDFVEAGLDQQSIRSVSNILDLIGREIAGR
jgi:acyl carrier protein